VVSSQRPAMALTAEERRVLEAVARSRMVPVAKQERARMVLAYADGVSIADIARSLQTYYLKVRRTLDRVPVVGPVAALNDRPRRGRKTTITPEARAWLVALACQKPKDLGYSYEQWTMRLLAQHVRRHAAEAGHPSLQSAVPATVWRILSSNKIQPHRMRYYLERRDPEFERKMVEVLHVYKEVELLRDSGPTGDERLVVLSCDEKPGLQAIGTTAPDRPPVPGSHPTWARDHEYVRYGTMSLLAAIDLLDGQVLGHVVERHTSAAFIEFLRMLDARYPAETTIRLVLDNHSIHTSRETKAYLDSRPNRFDLVFTPKHGSWLNLIESFFGKMARTVLRGMRVSSKEDLKQRLELYFEELNREPITFRWTYKLDELAVA
jgi:transposase